MQKVQPHVSSTFCCTYVLWGGGTGIPFVNASPNQPSMTGCWLNFCFTSGNNNTPTLRARDICLPGQRCIKNQREKGRSRLFRVQKPTFVRAQSGVSAHGMGHAHLCGHHLKRKGFAFCCLSNECPTVQKRLFVSNAACLHIYQTDINMCPR